MEPKNDLLFQSHFVVFGLKNASMGPRFCGVATLSFFLELGSVDFILDDGELTIRVDRFLFPGDTLDPLALDAVFVSVDAATAKKDLTDLVWATGFIASAVRYFMDDISGDTACHCSRFASVRRAASSSCLRDVGDGSSSHCCARCVSHTTTGMRV